MKEIPLTQGKIAIVDDQDYEMLSHWKWSVMHNGQKWYAQRVDYENRKTILMHRVITDAPSGMDVDHANGDGLDNRRENLRVCTRSQNLANQSAKPNNLSGYKGVSWDKRMTRWIAFISVNNKTINLGRFDSREKAHEAYSQAAQTYFGEFARME
jgi:hypothetical protein